MVDAPPHAPCRHTGHPTRHRLKRFRKEMPPAPATNATDESKNLYIYIMRRWLGVRLERGSREGDLEVF